MTQSVRARLTAWNGSVFASVLLLLGVGAYALLAHATIEQTDSTVEQQLRATLLTIHTSLARTATMLSDTQRVDTVVQDLRQRGFGVHIAGREGVLLTRPLHAELVEARVPTAGGGDTARGTAMAGVVDAIRARVGAGTAEQWRLPFTIPSDDGGVRVIFDTASVGSQRLIVGASEPLDEVDELLSQVRNTLLVAVPVLVGLALLMGYLLAGRALAPVAAMSSQARTIGARTMHERLAVPNPHDELGHLAGAFNAVLDRVDAALEQQQRFTADASHELRTPVAIIRSEAEVALDAEGRTPEEYREALRVIRDGSEQLSRIVNDMFLLARSDAGQAAIARAPIYLDELATDVVRSMSALAAARGISLALEAPHEVPYLGDEALLKRVVVNLLDNAIKHAPPWSVVTVALQTRSDGHVLSVTDTGAGVPAAARTLVFNRFFRVDEARSRNDGQRGTGAGLGLSIAREIAELHGGRLLLHERAAATTTFELVLPLSPALLP